MCLVIVRFCSVRTVKLLSRTPFLSPENVKRFSAVSQEDMNLDGTPVKAPSAFRRRIMPPTQQQRPQPRETEVEDQEFGACEEECEGEHRWTARDRTTVAKMEQYLNESDNMKVEIGELELLLGPEDSEVDLVKKLMNANRKKGTQDVQIFGSQGPSDFLVVNTLRW